MSDGSGSKSDQDDPTIPPRSPTDPDATIAPNSTTINPTVKLPAFEGYELLQELGRGGMGVVYKARDLKLDRTVALKMIIGGKFASDEEVRRFQIEAESSARLDHPGIVPIYEIGQSNDNHFFSMKLIDGKSLLECLDDYKPDPRKSAQLISQIGRAVQHAHERGVLHRDLKPGNILIDENGTPSITDFGLAKQMDNDSGMTQTGLVMGSPGFMSPEQAAGQSDVTTGVDIYALGALLYWLITGRPPFEGDSRLDVIMQTIDKTPESVRVFVPNADRDLNLICQKALRKSASARYATAAEFADDIDAWMQGDALSVKPPTTLDHARIWIRKNFRTVSIALSAGILCGVLVGMCTLLISVRQMAAISLEFAALGETQTSWVVRYFSWVTKIPKGVLIAFPPMMIWLNVFFGIVTIGLIKPKSREVGLVAATAAALLSGILAYTVNLGWAPIERYAVAQGRHDIELIADGFWMEDPNERALAHKALLMRYPGLKDVNENQRGFKVYRKIIHDQTLGIPKGMWLGIGTTLCLAVFPLFFATTFAGLVWDRGGRGWEFFGKSIELGIYAGLFFLLTSKWVAISVGTPPGFWFQLLTITGVLWALYLGISLAKTHWRIFGFLIANVCVFANFAESYYIDNASDLVHYAKTENDYRTATKYFEKKLRHNANDDWGRFQLGVVYAHLDEESGYQTQCTNLLNNFSTIYRANVAERLVKVCMLRPEYLSESELANCYQLAEMVSGYESSYDSEWLYFVRAMSELRQQHHESTLEWTNRCRESIETKENPQRTILKASTFVIDALSCQQNDQFDLAKKWLKLAAESYGGEFDSQLGSKLDHLIFGILMREFENGR